MRSGIRDCYHQMITEQQLLDKNPIATLSQSRYSFVFFQDILWFDLFYNRAIVDTIDRNNLEGTEEKFEKVHSVSV